MAPPVLSDDEKKAAMAKGGADLKYLFGRNDVSKEVQAIWFHVGVTTLEKFANIAKDEKDLLTVLKDHIGVDQDASLEQRVQAASLTCAWMNARTRVQRSAEVEAEMDTNEWRKPIVASEWLAMKAGLEGAVGILDDSVMPSKEYVEKKLQELEAGDYRAEDLTEVVSKDQVDPDSLLPQWDAKGNLSVRRGATKVKEPESPEGLRKRLTIMRNACQMVALKHTGRPELQGDYVRTFEEYKDYLLGEHVYGLNSRDADGLVISAPPFRLVLAYEKAISQEDEPGRHRIPHCLETILEVPHNKRAALHDPAGPSCETANTSMESSGVRAAGKEGQARGKGIRKGWRQVQGTTGVRTAD